MKFDRMLPPICKLALSLAALGAGIGFARPSLAAPPRRSAIKAGQVILYLQAGTAKADADALAATVNATETPMLLQDCYLLTLDNNSQTENATTAAAATLRADPRVRWVNPNFYRFIQQAAVTPTTKPNDPRYPEQWGLVMINMPQAWVLQKGVVDVNAAVADSGFDKTHEDFQGRLSNGSFDLSTMLPDVTPDGSGPELQHGMHVSGIIAANADNGIGVASVTWQNTQVVGLKVHKKGDPDNAINGAAYISALQYCADNKDKFHIVTLNLSLGGPGDPNDTTAPEYQGIKNCTDKGIIVCAAAGNSNADDHMDTPAGFSFSPLILTVSALGQTGKKSSFSSFGKVDIAAPGGDFDNGNAGQILSTLDGAYGVESGTSQATPHVTGVATLLMSIPGVTPLQAVTTMRNTANRTGITTVPDINSGFGILDAYAAISQLATRIVILSPDGVNLAGQSSDPANVVPLPVETFKPMVSFHISNVPCDKVIFNLDASIPSIAKTFPLSDLIAGKLPVGITDFSITGACTGVPNPMYDVSFRVTMPTTGFFQHTIMVTGTNPNSGLTATDTRLFTLTPHTIQSGLTMDSIPYFESAADAPPPFTGSQRDVAQLLGPNVTIYRYLLPALLGSQPKNSTVGPYARFSATSPVPNVNATFHPTDTDPMPTTPPTGSSGAPVDTRPVGLGFFIDTPAAIPVFTFGQSFSRSSFRIPLHEGWNMIGDPYPFAIAFNSVEIETTTGARLTAGQAADQNLILPHIYRLVNGDYQFSTLPDGSLQAWEGQWIYVVPKDVTNLNPSTVLTLIATPTPASTTSTRATGISTASLTRATGAGSWKLQLAAHVGDKSDANNYVGMSGSATDSIDKTKVPKPPRPDSTVSLSIVRSDAPTMSYAQDLRSLAGTKQWNIVVATDQPNTNVTVEWPNSRTLPKNYSLILTDQVTGRAIDVRNSSSYQFNSGATPGARSFSLVARSTVGVSGHPVFSNIIVNPARGTGGRGTGVYNIAYNLSTPANVSVSIMTAGGHPVAQIVSRAVGAGDNSLTWNGADEAGRPLGAGSYIMQFQAATTDGQTTRIIQPLIITGR